jgi:hypothetical protein
MLAAEIFEGMLLPAGFEANQSNAGNVKFWLN